MTSQQRYLALTRERISRRTLCHLHDGRARRRLQGDRAWHAASRDQAPLALTPPMAVAMNYPAASCEVSPPRLRVAVARQFGGEAEILYAHLKTTPTGYLGDAVVYNLFHCPAAAHIAE